MPLHRGVEILISSCLIGIPSRYNEDCERIESLICLVYSGRAIFVCPEQLGGLPTPREPVEIEVGKTANDVLKGQGKVLTKSGKDVTKELVSGAQRVLKLCQEFGIKIAIFKARSPSCASKTIYDGTFTSMRKLGKGITAELLSQNGIQVFNEENFPKSLLWKISSVSL